MQGLTIGWEYLTGYAVATDPSSRKRAEWPPHPARLFYALVDALHARDKVDPQEERALRWLEAQAAPEIVASPADDRMTLDVYVPVNGTDVSLHDVARAADRAGRLREAADQVVAAEREVAAARPGREAERAARRLERARTRYEKARAALRSVLEKAAAPRKDGTVPDKRLKQALQLLPGSRRRQKRPFPVCVPRDPRVVFRWPEARPSTGAAAALERLCGRVVRLGHSSSLVACRLTERSVRATWTPGEPAHRWFRVPATGLLDELRAIHEDAVEHGTIGGRILPAEQAAYRAALDEGEDQSASPPRARLAGRWIALRRVEGPWIPAFRSVDVAEAVRGAILAHAPEPVPPVLTGHAADGRRFEGPHLVVLALPWVGHRHADGVLRGIALLLPESAGGAGSRALDAALRSWLDSDTGRARLHMGRLGAWTLERYTAAVPVRTLEPWTWTRPSRTWATVTPVALDSNPGNMFASDPDVRVRAQREAERVVARACQRIGLPAPVSVELDGSPWVTGARHARAFAPFPRRAGPERFRRVLVHAFLRFAEPVEGPVILGAGRYLGLGLCRPLTD